MSEGVTGIDTGTITVAVSVDGQDLLIVGDVNLKWIPTLQVAIIVREKERIVTADVREGVMTEGGNETVVVMIGVCLGETHDVMTMIDLLEEIAIFSQTGWTGEVVERGEDYQEMIETNSQCKRKDGALHHRLGRRSLRQT